jgi:hypothetical protein
MKTSARTMLAAVAILTMGSVSFAQQANDANASGTSSAPDATMSSGRSTLDREAMNARSDMRRTCAGLSDRQTERACREGFPTQHADPDATSTMDRGGKTDDQAG